MVTQLRIDNILIAIDPLSGKIRIYQAGRLVWTAKRDPIRSVGNVG